MSEIDVTCGRRDFSFGLGVVWEEASVDWRFLLAMVLRAEGQGILLQLSKQRSEICLEVRMSAIWKVKTIKWCQLRSKAVLFLSNNIRVLYLPDSNTAQYDSRQ